MRTQEPMSIALGSAALMWNHLAGHIMSILHGLTQTTVKVMTEDEVIVTVRCRSESEQACISVSTFLHGSMHTMSS
jgi:hypothetical protein